MEEFVNFLLHYYREIILGLSIVLEIVILVVKHVKVKVNLPSNSLNQLIELVNEAESLYGEGNGKKKLNYVVEKYIKTNGIYWSDTMIPEYIKGLVEKLLNTPTKKGGPGREDEKAN